ncbi:hypothetical protein pb186bvf_000987 [Paramecium bursaria]
MKPIVPDNFKVSSQRNLEQNVPDFTEDDQSLTYGEVEARFMKILRHFEKINLQQVDWNGHLNKDLGLDSLERIALVTSIEHEFTVVFEDRVFDNLHTLNDLKKQIVTHATAY